MTSQIRIAHIVSTLGRGGIETWLRNIIPIFPRDHFSFDIIWTLPGLNVPGPLADDFREMGVPVYHCDHPIISRRGQLSLTQKLQQGGYDIIHLHCAEGGIHQHFAATLSGSGKRIMHLHNTRISTRHNILAPILFPVFRILEKKMVYLTIGNSRGTLVEYFGKQWGSKKYVHLVYYGIPVDLFKPSKLARDHTRKEFGWTTEDVVVGNVGSFSTMQKNQEAVLKTIVELRKRKVQAHGMFVGSGTRLNEIMSLASELQIENICHFLGSRSDVAELYPAMDVFLFPSFWEGFGLVSLEAQACGVPVVMANIPGLRETVIYKEYCRFIKDYKPETLADACQELIGQRTPGRLPKEHTIEEAALRLEEIYEGLVQGHDGL